MNDRVAFALLRSVARRGQAGRFLAPKAALVGLPAAADVNRVRSQVRELSPHMETARAAVYRTIWESAAQRVGARVRVGSGGYLEISDGRAVTTVRENLVELDNPVTLQIAGDRAVAAERLSRAGLPVAEHLTFTLADPAPALAFLERHGRCVVKPARNTGAGAGVTCDLSSSEELVRAALTAARHSPDLVIEQQLVGAEHRFLVLDGEVVAAVTRERPWVVGDGTSTVTDLVLRENKRRLAAGGRDGLFLLDLSLDACLTLRRQGMSPAAVPAPGVRVVVAGAVNTGASAQCAAEDPTPALAANAVTAVRALGLRWASVEMTCSHPEQGLGTAGEGVIEVNSTPGVTYHYQVRDPATIRPVADRVLVTLLRDGSGKRLRPDGPLRSTG